MKRNKKVMLMSHCVLNQNAVVKPLARAEGAFNDLVRLMLDADVSMVQLPCPETLFGGLARLPMSYEDYDIPEYKTLCTQLSDQTVTYLRALLEDGVTLLGILSIGESPTCNQTGKRGHFIEALRKHPEFDGIKAIDIPELYGEDEEETKGFNAYFKNYLNA